MKKTLVAGMMAAAASVMVPGLAGAEAVTADVPVGSVYYDYVDKLSGMGYIDSLPDGARPYSRMQMAKWVLQAEKNAKDKPMPAYLADELASMRTAFASEIEVLKGRSDQDDLALRQASLKLASYNSDQSSYKQSKTFPRQVRCSLFVLYHSYACVYGHYCYCVCLYGYAFTSAGNKYVC